MPENMRRSWRVCFFSGILGMESYSLTSSSLPLDIPVGYDKVLKAKEAIVQVLKDNGGVLKVMDKSSPERIHSLFGISKKTYKQAVGALHKARRIRIEPEGLFLT